jgi:hypothetical protein
MSRALGVLLSEAYCCGAFLMDASMMNSILPKMPQPPTGSKLRMHPINNLLFIIVTGMIRWDAN